MTSSFQLINLFELARGGMGVVHVAMRAEGDFRRLYVVKRLLPKLQDEKSVQAMFLEEARIAGHLRHPNVVGVLDVGSDREGPYLVMEYVDGCSAHDLLKSYGKRGQRVPMQVALEIGVHTATGLAAAHEAKDETGRALNVVHRDVSPHNILVGFDGVARLSDFGIARATGRTNKTSTGVLKGKLGYMAPEQLRFESPSTSTDIFSLGVTIYEMLTGTRLYPAGGDGLEGPKRILSEAPPDLGGEVPAASPELVQLMFELLAKQACDRPASAREVAERLQGCLSEVRYNEPTIDLGKFIEEFAGEKRTHRNQRIQAASKRAETRKPRWPMIAAVAAMLVVGVTGASLAWPAGTDPTTPTPGDARVPQHNGAQQTNAPVAAPMPVDIRPSAPVPTDSVDEHESDATAEREAPRPRRRPVARMDTPMEPQPTMEASAMSGLQTWGWRP